MDPPHAQPPQDESKKCDVVSTGTGKRKRRREQQRPAIQVVTCPSAFPVSQKIQRRSPDPKVVVPDRPSRSTASASSSSDHHHPVVMMDLKEAAKEVRNLGAQAFEGVQKRKFADEQFQRLTGRLPKKPRVPLPIVRGIRKAAERREQQRIDEARQAGLVTVATTALLKKKKTRDAQNKKSKLDKTYRLFGPAPTMDRTHNGILRIKSMPR